MDPEDIKDLPPVEAPEDIDGIDADDLVKMGSYLMQGMNETEAAVLAGIDKLKLMVARRTSETYNNYVERKKLEFKAKHLNIISRKADVKISQWLLERTNPEEFGTKAKREEVAPNAVAAIIKEIQDGSVEASSLKFAYSDIHDKGSNPQRPSKREAEDRIRSVLQ